jgi:hypothetical protein
MPPNLKKKLKFMRTVDTRLPYTGPWGPLETPALGAAQLIKI